MTPEHVREFCETGVVVVESVFSEEEVAAIRDRFHTQLATRGIHHERVLRGEQVLEQGARVKGNAASIFYAKWKLDTHLNARVVDCSRELLVQTFGSSKRPGYEHPFGAFTDVVPYIDRVCYRTPDSIRAESGLEMHIDNNPTNPYLAGQGGLKKWRPIQALLTLTDHFGSDCGGLRVVRGFHRETDQYFAGKTFEGKGEFCRLHDKAHARLRERLEPVFAPRGSLIFWDGRLPHATCQRLAGGDTREVVYIGFLPRVELNAKYWLLQAAALRANRFPPAYAEDDEPADRDWQPSDLSPLQRRLLFGE
jgi:hypothetical protein